MESKVFRSTNYSYLEIKKLKSNSKKYHEVLREFLQNFKVYECKQQSKHNFDLCFYYHDQTDYRRNPYRNHQFAYNIYEFCECNQSNCSRVHNQFQHAYHPLLYKTSECQNHNCDLGLYCVYYHSDEIVHFQSYGQFFRFDLRSFKTEKCSKKIQHQRKTCLYYHNDKDRRRLSNIEYSHFICSKQKCNFQNCEFSHNKLQQLYHPTRYKTKFCQHYTNNIQKCEYKSFCSFAHTQNQIKENIELIHLLQKNNDFYIYKYKTVWCPFTLNHERDKCPYAHNIQDYRRNPSEYQYEPIRCDHWKFSDEIKSIQNAGCKQGMDCKKCHGWMQQRYHPSKYNCTKRTKSQKKEEVQVAETIVNKKLTDLNLHAEYSKYKPKGVSNPQIIKSNYSKGTPFFKTDKYSQYSAKTKARSNNIESDKSVDGSSNRDPLKTNEQLIKPSISIHDSKQFSCFVDTQQQQSALNQFKQYWQESQELRKDRKNNEDSSSRSKSAQKSQQYCATYSNSIKQALQDDQILKKLKGEKFNEIQIANMDQKKIDKLSFLSQQQRNRLAMRLKIYSIKQANSVSYSKELTKYFVSKKKQTILQKMQQKRVKQVKLLKMGSKNINELSFLNADQKAQLPKLLKEYQNEKQFKELNSLIKQETSGVQKKE